MTRRTRTVGRARELRQHPTRGEARLWARLRNRRIGAKFRRQHPIGAYIVDFACVEYRLAIEVDGCSHWTSGPRDALRGRVLERAGWTIVRISEGDAAARPDATVNAIAAMLRSAR
ncbi:MAG: DUF559 domain-containing protein [Phycisphaerales bacterium]